MFSLDILEDESIDCVLELMGGTAFAKEVIFGAIEKGKHVITANKALIAGFMDELIALLAAHPSVKFLYEAAVGGGIPIIHTMRTTYIPDSVTNIAGELLHYHCLVLDIASSYSSHYTISGTFTL